MPVYDAGRIILHLTQSDETLAREALARIRDAEILEVGVEGRRGVLRKNSLADPILEVSRPAGVDVIGFGIRIATLAENYPHQIVRTLRQIPCPHLRADFVVRLRQQFGRI